MAQSRQRRTKQGPTDAGAPPQAGTGRATDSAAQQLARPRTRRPSLNDSLAATQRYSVPLLPALDGPDLLDEPDDDTPRPTTSYARATLAPQGSGRHPAPSASASGASKSGARRAPRAKRPPADAADTGRILLERADLDAPPGGVDALATARMPRAPQSGRLPEPPAVLDLDELSTALVAAPHPPAGPSASGDRLPVPRHEGPRDLALATPAPTETILIRGAKKPKRSHTARVVPKRLGPRPFATQFLIAMVTAMLLVGTLALATPLGRTAVFGSTFDAYASAIPWVPTPTPTPRPTATPIPLAAGYDPPHGPNPGVTVVQNEIKAVFGQYAAGALAVSQCESGWDPNARNPYPIGDSHAMGVFQILFPSTWSGTSYAQYSPYDYVANIKAAYQIFSRDGYTWREWECQP